MLKEVAAFSSFKKLLEEELGIPYPPNLLPSPHWAQMCIHVVRQFQEYANCHTVTKHSQCPSGGFELRLPATTENVGQKYGELKELFPEFDPYEFGVNESPFSVPESLCSVAGLAVSNTFLWHIFTYLSIEKHLGFDNITHIVEIGGGYGQLARIFTAKEPQVRYTIVDLPTSLFQARCYLFLNRATSVEFVPSQKVADIPSCDLVINTGSFAEMKPETVQEFLDQTQRMGAKWLYSFNNAPVENFKPHDEWASNPEPKKPNWKTLHRAINPITCPEGLPRDRLEVIYEL